MATSPQPDQGQQLSLELVAALSAYQARTQALRASLATYVSRLWASLGSYRTADLPKFVSQVVPVVAGAQRQMASLTVANLAQQKQIALGGRLVPAPIDISRVIGPAARNGADVTEVYSRPFHLVWRQLHDLPREDGAIDQAIGSGLQRAIELAQDDLQLTKQHTVQETLTADRRAHGYRRVLEGAHSCGLCIVAATRLYHKANLLPIHGGCDCSVATVFEPVDPDKALEVVANVDGRLVPVGNLNDVHARIKQRFGRTSPSAGDIPGTRDGNGRILQYRDALITHEHGELGPVLAVRGEKFTGPREIAA